MRQERLREQQIKKTLEQASKIENAINQPYYDLKNHLNLSVNIRVVKTVAPAMFKPDPINPGGWIANELTFRAMKKDIFTLGDDIDELKSPHTCIGCNSQLDLLFWQLCPYCGKDLPL